MLARETLEPPDLCSCLSLALVMPSFFCVSTVLASADLRLSEANWRSRCRTSVDELVLVIREADLKSLEPQIDDVRPGDSMIRRVSG